MKDDKKNEYWGTSVRRFVTDGEKQYHEIGTIYVNLKDCEDSAKIVDIVKHELKHLIDDKLILKEVIKNIDNLDVVLIK